MINVYLVQPNYTLTINQKINYWLPYSAATIWSFASKNPVINKNYKLADILFYRQNINEYVDTIEDNSIIAMSCYVWNWQYNQTLAKKIKETKKNCYIVVGGPEITNRPLENNFFRQYPYIDSIVLGEGEITFNNVLLSNLEGKPKRIYHSSRIDNIDEIPSPYLNGIFDKIVSNNSEALWSTVIETNRGCPFQCTFCDWGSLTYSKIKKYQLERVFSELEWVGKNSIDFLSVADANFGIFKERDFLISEKICEVKEKYGFPRNIGFSFNKNSNTDIIEIVKLLNKSNLSRGLTVSFQSMNQGVLKNIKRINMDINNAREIFSLLDYENLAYYSELILGLPGESLTTWKQGMVCLLDNGQHQCIDVFPAMLLENSELNSIESKSKFNIKHVVVQNFTQATLSNSQTEIPEIAKLVRSTDTMSSNDYIRSYMFAWIIINFHSYGWTQIYSRFLNNQKKLNYYKFYNLLENFLLQKKLPLLSNWYFEYQKNITDYLDNHQEFLNAIGQQDILRDVQTKMHSNREKIFEEINEIFLKTINLDINDTLLCNLKNYQNHYVSNFQLTYPYTVFLDKGIFKVINGNHYRENIDSCQVSLNEKFKDQKEFLEMLTTRRRNNWGKSILKFENIL